jgi:non-ribosomal peptide synthetase component F
MQDNKARDRQDGTAVDREDGWAASPDAVDAAEHAAVNSPARMSQFIVGEDPRHPGATGERLDAFFEEIAQRNGPRPAVICEGRTWSYAEIDGRANQLARLLIARGLKPGDRVGLLLNRSADTYVAMLAVM